MFRFTTRDHARIIGERPIDQIAFNRVAVPIGRALRFPVDQAADRLGDIVDIGEVAPHLAVVENLDRLAGEDRLGENEHRHVRTSPGTIHRKEAQACRGKPIEMAVGMRHQLVGLFRCSIEADRVIDIVVDRKRQFRVGAINR